MTRLEIVLLSSVCLELSGCTQYMNRYVERLDTINISAGDAIATNEALMVPDPWPRYAYDTNIAFDGERIGRAVQIYREGLKQPVETLPDQRKKQFGPKFLDAGTGLSQRDPGKGFFLPAQETSTGRPHPPASSLNVNSPAAEAPAQAPAPTGEGALPPANY